MRGAYSRCMDWHYVLVTDSAHCPLDWGTLRRRCGSPAQRCERRGHDVERPNGNPAEPDSPFRV